LGIQDYNQGYQNPNAGIDYSKSLDYIAGQDQAQKDWAKAHEGGGSGSPLAQPKQKSYFFGVLLSVLAGPFGLLYASKIGAAVVLAGVAGLFFTTGGSLGPQVTWGIGQVASVAWSIVAINAYNRKAASDFAREKSTA